MDLIDVIFTIKVMNKIYSFHFPITFLVIVSKHLPMDAWQKHLWWGKRAKKNKHCITNDEKSELYVHFWLERSLYKPIWNKTYVWMFVFLILIIILVQIVMKYVLGVDVSSSILQFFDFIFYYLVTFSIFSFNKNIICTYALAYELSI